MKHATHSDLEVVREKPTSCPCVHPSKALALTRCSCCLFLSKDDSTCQQLGGPAGAVGPAAASVPAVPVPAPLLSRQRAGGQLDEQTRGNGGEGPSQCPEAISSTPHLSHDYCQLPHNHLCGLEIVLGSRGWCTGRRWDWPLLWGSYNSLMNRQLEEYLHTQQRSINLHWT